MGAEREGGRNKKDEGLRGGSRGTNSSARGRGM